MRRALTFLLGLPLAWVMVWQTGVMLSTVRADAPTPDAAATPTPDAAATPTPNAAATPTPSAAATPRTNQLDPSTLRQQIVKDDEIDEDALRHIEERGNKLVSAAANFEAARFEREHKRTDSALEYLQRALEFAPDQAALHQLYAAILLDQGQYKEAVDEGGRAAELAPNSADVQRFFGLACYNARKLDQAVAAWERAQELAPNDVIAQNLAKAKRELAVEGNFNELALGHFVLRYEGGKPAEALTGELFHTLEHDYDDLSADLATAPSMVITVTLYSKQQFFDVTQAPEWVGALNDGALRIPMGDLSEVTPQLETVLKHELTHSFVHTIVPNCPVWLNEGLAQLEEGKSFTTLPPNMRTKLAKTETVPLHDLEGAFTGMNGDQARLAYAKSLAATEYLRESYGLPGVRRLLDELAEGKEMELALRELTDAGYDGLERDLRTYLTPLSPPGEPPVAAPAASPGAQPDVAH